MKNLRKNGKIINISKTTGDFMILFAIDFLDNDADKAFVEKLYIEYMPFFRYRAYKYVNNTDIANELAHDCMVNIIRHLDSIKKLPEDKIRAYLSVCINNISKNYLKRSSKQVATGVYDLADDYYLSDGTSVEDEVEQKYNYEVMRAGFDKLCERDQSIIVMKYDLELKDTQIADVLEIKQDSVRMTVLRCVKRLRKQIKKQEATV